MPKWPVPSNISTASFELDIGNLDHDDDEPDVPVGIFNTVFFPFSSLDAIINLIKNIQYYSYQQP